MAWTAPRTWVAGEVVTAGLLNTHLRDNLLETAPAKVAAKGDLVAGTGPNAIARVPVGANGQVLVADATQTAGVRWAGRVFNTNTVASWTFPNDGTNSYRGTEYSAISVSITPPMGAGLILATAHARCETDDTVQVRLRRGTDYSNIAEVRALGSRPLISVSHVFSNSSASAQTIEMLAKLVDGSGIESLLMLQIWALWLPG